MVLPQSRPLLRVGGGARFVGVKLIPPEVPTEVKLVLWAKVVINFRVQVVEIVARFYLIQLVLLLGSNQRRGQHVNVGTATRHQEGRFTLGQRPFQRQSGRDQPDAPFAVELVLAALLHVHIQHRRQPPTVPGREAPFGQFHTFQRVAVEDGEKTEKVAGVVHHGIVQNDEVLVRSPAAYIQARLAFGTLLHAGHQLQYFQDILFAKESGYLLDLGDGYLNGTHLGRAAHVVFLPPGRNGHLFELVDAGEQDVDLGILSEFQVSLHFFIAHKREYYLQGVRGWHGKGIKSVGIGHGSERSAGYIHIDSRQKFLAPGLLHKTTYRNLTLSQAKMNTRKE